MYETHKRKVKEWQLLCSRIAKAEYILNGLFAVGVITALYIM